MEAVFSTCGDERGAQTDDIRQALREAGVTVLLCGKNRSTQSPCLLFFSEFSPDLLDTVSDLQHHGQVRVLAIASNALLLDGDSVWQLLQAGAADVFAWDTLTAPADYVAARLQNWLAVDSIVDSKVVRENLVGRSALWTRVLRQTIQTARFSDASALVLGESGTGKEMIARLIHTLDGRPEKADLVILDCTTLVPDLAGSELFGHERGAFTNAVAAREGVFGLARGGTLFLDEIGELPLALQAQLLRAIQEKTYKRVGGNTWYETDFRLVCATNRDLRSAVATGGFRHDLYHRIAATSIRLPSLRDRSEDILPLAKHFIAQCCRDAQPPTLDACVESYLVQRDYPGNVRELQQVVCRIMTRYAGTGPLTAGTIPEDDRPTVSAPQRDWRDAAFQACIRRALTRGVGLKDIGRAAEDMAINIALGDEKGNLRRAARRLNVSDRALQLRRASGRRVGQSPAG